MDHDWALQTLQSLKECQDSTQFYQVFCDSFIKCTREADHEDDMLFFVNSVVEPSSRLQIRRMPSDSKMPETGITPNWRETLFLNLICRIRFTLKIQLLDQYGREKFAHCHVLFAAPNEIIGSEGKQKCKLRTTYPLLVFPASEQSSLKKLPIQKHETFKLSLAIGGDRVIVEETISYDVIRAEYLAKLKMKRMAPPGHEEELTTAVKLSQDKTAVFRVTPFSLTEQKVGVKSAFYSLILRRPLALPTRYICQLTAFHIDWESLLGCLFINTDPGEQCINDRP